MQLTARSLLPLCLALLPVACGDGSHSPGDAAASTIGAGSEVDPGVPPAFYGPKCTVEAGGAELLDCVSAVITPGAGRVHVFLNFCMVNGVDRCAAAAKASPIYASFVLPIPDWQVGQVGSTVGGRIEVVGASGRHRAAGAFPINLSITAAPVMGGGTALLGDMTVQLPTIEGAGPPLSLRIRIP